MELIDVSPDDLSISPELARSRTSKVFEEHLKASIEEMGLAEPLKVAPMPGRKYLVIDGMLRFQAIQALRSAGSQDFESIPAYVVDIAKRYEIRFQTDIYQDLLPSQLATLVEHLHQAENVRKIDIAKSIGVSPATLRNYTGLWRLMDRGGLFAQIVELMDVGVMPASNPFAWLRLTEEGLRFVLENSFSDLEPAEEWIEWRAGRARRGDVAPYSIQFVETVTGSLSGDMYMAGAEVRALKQALGRSKGVGKQHLSVRWEATTALQHLKHVSMETKDPVLSLAVQALTVYLQ